MRTPRFAIAPAAAQGGRPLLQMGTFNAGADS
jgi:hypothetical protein